MESHKYYTSQQLARTNCSLDFEEPPPNPSTPSRQRTKNTKKRVGDYSFYYKHLIGSGYGGRVYKGQREDEKGTWYAIKVIRLK